MKTKITTAGLVTMFILTNSFFISPMTSAYGVTMPEKVNKSLASIVAPLGISYPEPGSEHIDTDPSTWQRLTTPLTKIETAPVDMPSLAVQILPEMSELTNENTFNLTDEEYYKVISQDRSYDVLKSIDIAYEDVGNTYLTGWSQRGECIMSVSHWVKSAGANWGSGGNPVDNYSTAKRVPLDNLQAGDIIQYINLAQPKEWISGVHTVLVTGNNWDGTYKIVESNFNAPGLVSKNDKWKPTPPPDFEAAAFRF